MKTILQKSTGLGNFQFEIIIPIMHKILKLILFKFDTIIVTFHLFYEFDYIAFEDYFNMLLFLIFCHLFDVNYAQFLSRLAIAHLFFGKDQKITGHSHPPLILDMPGDRDLTSFPIAPAHILNSASFTVNFPKRSNLTREEIGIFLYLLL